MATVTKKKVKRLQQFGGAPYGNLTSLVFRFATNASGVMVDSDQSTAIAIGDVVRIGFIPAGSLLLDHKLVVSDAFAASTTMKLGFAYVDGEDVTAVPQDDDYFHAAGTALSSTAIIRKLVANAPVRVPKDVYIILTNAGAAHSAAGILDFILDAELKGAE